MRSGERLAEVALTRREFAASLAGIAAGFAAPAASLLPHSRATLPARELGRTGLKVTILGLGGHHVALTGSEAAARRLVEVALDAGVRFFDTAESYGAGRSERWLGAALRGARSSVVLMTKTYAPRERSAESARRHLEGSLQRLETDYLDLWQLHSVQSVADVDRAFRPGGAIEYLLEAKAQGIVRFVGITGHVTPAAHRRALDYFDRGFRFDAMQLPINPIDYHQRSFQRDVLPGLVERGVGAVAMKTSADGALPRERVCTIEECLRYVWTLPVSVAVVGMERPDHVRANARLALGFAAMSADELRALRERIQPRARLSLEWYKRS